MARKLDNHEPIVRLALIQQRCTPGSSRQQNVQRASAMIRQAAADGARIVALQELFTCGYFPQTEDAAHFALAESVPGPTTEAMAQLAGELGIEIIVSIFEKRASGLYHNTAVLLDAAGKLAGRYRKMHIPDDPLFYEKFYFTPGDLGFVACPTRDVAVGMLICWDQWFPEAARLTAMRGAQIIFCPTAIGYVDGETQEEQAQQRQAWLTIQQSHAIANGLFFAAINRVGREGKLDFWGTSFVCDPHGKIIAQACGDDEQILIADCDLRQVEEARTGWPFVRDRRIDAYDGLTQRFLD